MSKQDQTLYEEIKVILEEEPKTRDSDFELIWRLYERRNGGGETWGITKEDFFNLPNIESITRAARKIREHHEELRGSTAVERGRELARQNWGKKTYLSRSDGRLF